MKALSNDAALRSTLVAAAQEIVKNPPAGSKREEVPPAGGAGAAAPGEGAVKEPDVSASVRQIQEIERRIQALHLPIASSPASALYGR